MTKLEELAALPCKECGGKGFPDAAQLWHVVDFCRSCNGTGALVPGLRKPCLDEECQKNKGYVAWTGAPYCPEGDTQMVKHPECDGRLWTVVSEAEAFLVMWNYCICRAWQVLRVADTTMIVEIVEDSFLNSPIVHVRIIATAEGTDAQALADAIMQVKR